MNQIFLLETTIGICVIGAIQIWFRNHNEHDCTTLICFPRDDSILSALLHPAYKTSSGERLKL